MLSFHRTRTTFPATATVLEGTRPSPPRPPPAHSYHRHRPGLQDPGDVRAAVDADPALVSLSTWLPQRRAADMAAVTEIVHQAGALMRWDLLPLGRRCALRTRPSCGRGPVVGLPYKYYQRWSRAPLRSSTARPLREVLRSRSWGWFPARRSSLWDPGYTRPRHLPRSDWHPFQHRNRRGRGGRPGSGWSRPGPDAGQSQRLTTISRAGRRPGL